MNDSLKSFKLLFLEPSTNHQLTNWSSINWKNWPTKSSGSVNNNLRLSKKTSGVLTKIELLLLILKPPPFNNWYFITFSFILIISSFKSNFKRLICWPSVLSKFWSKPNFICLLFVAVFKLPCLNVVILLDLFGWNGGAFGSKIERSIWFNAVEFTVGENWLFLIILSINLFAAKIKN